MKKALIYKLYNNKNILLYVGITNRIKHRLSQHKKDKEWFKEVDKISITNNVNRNKAHIYEIYYIANDKPKYNIDFSNGGSIDIVLPELKFNIYNLKIKTNSKSKIFTKEEILKCAKDTDLLLKKYIDKKLFAEEQKEISSFILSSLKECTICNLHMNKYSNTSKIQVSTLKCIIKELKLNYTIASKKEWARKNGNYGKNYITIKKTLTNFKEPIDKSLIM